MLYDELALYPSGEDGPQLDPAFGEIAVPLRLRAGETVVSSLSTRTSFGTALDVTVAELSIESFFPADRDAADAMQAYAAGLAERDGS